MFYIFDHFRLALRIFFVQLYFFFFLEYIQIADLLPYNTIANEGTTHESQTSENNSISHHYRVQQPTISRSGTSFSPYQT
jgi:hypothetical protein